MKVWIIIGLVLLAAIPARAAGACKLTRLTSLNIVWISDIPAVFGAVLGQDQVMIVDTGGAFSMLTDTAVDRLGLVRKPLGNIDIRDAFGRRLEYYVTVPNFQLGPLGGRDLNFLVMPHAMAPPGADGLLAPDALGLFGVEFDFALNRLNLHSPDHCPGEVVYWTRDPYTIIPVQLSSVQHLLFKPTLDGQTIESVLDTGAGSSFMPLKTAQRIFQWPNDPPGMTKTEGRINNAPVTIYSYPFKTLDIEGLKIQNPLILLNDRLDFSGGTDLVVGMAVLRKLHLFISYKEKKVYATPADARLPLPGTSFAPRTSFAISENPQWPSRTASGRALWEKILSAP